ncbi:MAG: hypothetical protein ACPGAP_09925, partial [Akkermansiaceae bacterium]
MWKPAAEFTDIRYEKSEDGAIAKITINRPEVRNAFRPLTVKELLKVVTLLYKAKESEGKAAKEVPADTAVEEDVDAN